ncbi:hypothetical protein ACAG26_05135 [Mycobacterium sp. pUA109]|uniref:hypothetical protein n=1 Tax=Mycobacterium sp. pUA109 TaxID=3238982 RepID=UPI00351B8BDA
MAAHQTPDSDWRLLQPVRYGGRGLPGEEFVSAVCALAGADGSAGWLAAMFNAAAAEVAALPAAAGDAVWGDAPAALVAAGYQPGGQRLRDGQLSGRWTVTGAERADWLLLSADDRGVRYRVLVPRGDAQIEPSAAHGLAAAGICAVTAAGLRVEERRLFSAPPPTVLVGAGAAAAVIGAADGLWRVHVEQVRDRLATSYGSEEITAATTTRVARAACDLDAAALQIAASLTQGPGAAAAAQLQAVTRARGAADHLLGGSRRHALDASDPVTRFWQDVHAGCRLTLRLLG